MRIAIVNDLILATEAVRRVVLGSGMHEIAWTAADGEEAVELCSQDTPDLILMDLIMPGLGGVEATRRIMMRCPCAILVVTANVDKNCSQVFEAMGAGALDAVNTPALEGPGPSPEVRHLLTKIETIRKLIGADTSVRRADRRALSAFQSCPPEDRLIAIGASAGGPAAVSRILACLPANFRSPIVVVQHVDSQFAPGLANWLGQQSPLRVALAQEGDSPVPGTVLLAGQDLHLVLRSPRRLGYSDQPPDSSYRPSVDVFFQSTRRHWPGDVIGVLLTGMGRDGAQGLLGLRQDGHHTIAQDRSTSAVYGMPKTAAALGAATEILRLDQIGVRLRAFGSQGIRVHA
jgi:two-component system, chemotaxis family, response regulator WspF